MTGPARKTTAKKTASAPSAASRKQAGERAPERTPVTEPEPSSGSPASPSSGEGLPDYVYVASSWRNPAHPAVIQTLRAAGIDCYDFRNPEGSTGFSWREVKTPDGPESARQCGNCGEPIVYSTFLAIGFEPDVDAANDPVTWRHSRTGYAVCRSGRPGSTAMPKKGSDYEQVDEYLRMIEHPRAVEGFEADFAAMQRADTFVLVLPCGKSAHLELGWAVGAGKRTAILLEDPTEPELMYRMVDHLARDVDDLLGWLGVKDS